MRSTESEVAEEMEITVLQGCILDLDTIGKDLVLHVEVNRSVV